MMNGVYNVRVIRYLTIALAFISHALGIRILCCYADVSNKALLLLKLSVTDVAALLLSLTSDLSHAGLACMVDHYEERKDLHENISIVPPSYYRNISKFLFRIIICDYLLTILVLAVDRSIYLYNFKFYERFMSIKMIKTLTVGSLALSFGTAIGMLHTTTVVFRNFCATALLLFLILWIGMILQFVRKYYSIGHHKYLPVEMSKRINFPRDYAVITLISLVHSCFYCVPTYLVYIHAKESTYRETNSFNGEGIETLFCLGFLLHSCLYLLLNNRYRSRLISLLLMVGADEEHEEIKKTQPPEPQVVQNNKKDVFDIVLENIKGDVDKLPKEQLERLQKLYAERFEFVWNDHAIFEVLEISFIRCSTACNSLQEQNITKIRKIDFLKFRKRLILHTYFFQTFGNSR